MRTHDMTTVFVRDVRDPRALATILEKAERDLAAKEHPDPVIRAYPNLLCHTGTECISAIQLRYSLAALNGISLSSCCILSLIC
jgi:hypothetical protein